MIHIIAAISAAMHDTPRHKNGRYKHRNISDGYYDEFPHGYYLDEYRKPIAIPIEVNKA